MVTIPLTHLAQRIAAHETSEPATIAGLLELEVEPIQSAAEAELALALLDRLRVACARRARVYAVAAPPRHTLPLWRAIASYANARFGWRGDARLERLAWALVSPACALSWTDRQRALAHLLATGHLRTHTTRTHTTHVWVVGLRPALPALQATVLPHALPAQLLGESEHAAWSLRTPALEAWVPRGTLEVLGVMVRRRLLDDAAIPLVREDMARLDARARSAA